MTNGLVVLYAYGAVSAAQLGVHLADLGPLTFAVRDDAHGRRVAGLLERFGEVFFLPAGQEDADEAAVAAVAARRPAGVVTFAESMLPLLGKVCETLGLPGPDSVVVRALTDKGRQRAVLRAAGVDSVRSARAADRTEFERAAAAIGLPVVVKPARGQGSRDAVLVETSADIRAVARNWKDGHPVVVEEFLVGTDEDPFGDYVSVECRSENGHASVLAVTGKLPLVPPFREQGQFWPAHVDSARQAAAANLARRAVEAIGLSTGLTHTEVKLTRDGPRIIEVNGRLGGNIGELARLVGVNLARTAALDALGRGERLPPMGTNRILFQVGTLAPRTMRRLLAVSGSKEASRLPGVVAYRRDVQDGSTLEPGTATTWIDRVFGETSDHATMLELIAGLREILRYTYVDVDGVEHTAALPLADGS